MSSATPITTWAGCWTSCAPSASWTAPPDLEQLVNLGLRIAANRDPTGRPVDRVPLRHQVPQRLAHRDAGNAELGGQIALHQPRAWRHPPVDDPTADLVANERPEPVVLGVIDVHRRMVCQNSQPRFRPLRRPLATGAGLLAVVDMELAQRMLDAVDQIPAGRVSTYGDIAARAGSRSPRLAGFVLSQLSDEQTPWHRVVRADGTPAPHLAEEQLARLRAEGVTASDGQVSLARYRFLG